MNKIEIADAPDGFYLLSNSRNCDVCLVRVYTPSDEPKYRGVGFGIWDGCAFMPFSELTADSNFVPVEAVNLQAVRDQLEIQGAEGNWNHSDYMLGMYNGIECALATLENREPVYRELRPNNKGD